MSTQLSSQILEAHKGEHRIVLLLTETESDPNFQDQIDRFRDHVPGLEERKLIVYHITPKSYRQVFVEKTHTAPNETAKELYEQYAIEDSSFTFVLIGLDGMVKKRQVDVMPASELFDLIDAMPMRKEEIRKKK